MQISNEVLIGLIAIVSTVLGAWAYTAKRKADAALEKARAAKREADARAEQVESEAKARLLQVQTETSQSQSVMKLFEQQIIINQQGQKDRESWWAALEKKESRDEGNYRHLADTQRDNTQMLLTEMQKQHREVISILGKLPEQLVKATQDSFKLFAGELAALLAEQFAKQNLKQDLPPFPDATNAKWQVVMIKPTVPELKLRTWPFFWDDVTAAASIQTEGEKVLLAEDDRRADWYAVHKQSNPPMWGWIPRHTVQIVKETVTPA